VLVRSSGTPTFYLASSVDDAEDAVTHLVRAVPMVRATAAQLHIWRAIGVEPPSAGHVPLVTGPGGAPVRFGSAAATVRALREHGIGRSALLAYLALPETASWKTPPTDLEEIIPRINLRRLARRPLTFDQRALETLNRRQR
jgi:glutamyl-tRNA synthetase